MYLLIAVHPLSSSLNWVCTIENTPIDQENHCRPKQLPWIGIEAQVPGNQHPDVVQYHRQYGNWSPTPPPVPPPPGNYGYQTPEFEAKPYIGRPVSPMSAVPVGADEASIRSDGPETDLRSEYEYHSASSFHSHSH